MYTTIVQVYLTLEGYSPTTVLSPMGLTIVIQTKQKAKSKNMDNPIKLTHTLLPQSGVSIRSLIPPPLQLALISNYQINALL